MIADQELPTLTLSPHSVSVLPRAGQQPPGTSAVTSLVDSTETSVPAAFLPHWGTALTQQQPGRLSRE